VEVRESRRSRRLRLVVHPDGAVEAVVPCATPDRDVDRLIGTHRDWLVSRVTVARERAAIAPRLELARPHQVSLHGRWVPMVKDATARAEARMRDGVLVVGGRTDPDATAALNRWYRREARRIVEATVARHAQRLGVSHGPVAIRDPRTRWGSCSRRGALSFSWRLVLAPSEVLEYVVVHELCHVVEPNHSKAFWRLVDASRPGWQAEAAWLRTHGHELHAFDPSVAVAEH
jgi:predicted metal-dependent hydrolase